MILKYGLHEEGIKYIDDVDGGLDCNCTCISCGEKLIARNKGEVNEHHFAHRSGNTCNDLKLVVSTYLFKEALEEIKELTLPKVFIKIDNCDSNFLIEDQRIVKINKIIEYNKNLITILTDAYKELYLIFRLKKRKLEVDFDQENKDVLEVIIDTSNIETKEDVLRLISNNNLKLKWLNNKYEQFQNQKLNLLLERKRFINQDKTKIVKDCPINIRIKNKESFAILEEDCVSCKNYLCGDKKHDIIYCLGKAKIAPIKDLEKIESVEKTEDKTIINYLDGSMEKIDIKQFEATSLLNLWQENKNKPFLARNIETNIAVFIKRDPHKQHNKYNKCYGLIYKNGHLLGDREIYGYLLDHWLIIPNKKRKENLK